MSNIEDAKKLPKMEANEERRGVMAVSLQSITKGDTFVHTLDITYMEMVNVESLGKMRPEHRREKVAIPPSRALLFKIKHLDGCESQVFHFPIQIFDEVWTTTPITPYVKVGGHQDRDAVACKIKLTESNVFDTAELIIEPEYVIKY